MQGAGNKIGEIYSYKWISEYKWILLSIDILGFIFIILIIWYGTIFSDDLIVMICSIIGIILLLIFILNSIGIFYYHPIILYDNALKPHYIKSIYNIFLKFDIINFNEIMKISLPIIQCENINDEKIVEKLYKYDFIEKSSDSLLFDMESKSKNYILIEILTLNRKKNNIAIDNLTNLQLFINSFKTYREKYSNSK